MLFTNPMLEEEVYPIHTNLFPEHDTYVNMIIHTENDDYYPANVIGMDVVRDYDGKVTDNVTLSMMLGLGEYNTNIKPNRDKLQITITVNYNGKVYENRYKAIVLVNDVDDMRNYEDDFKDKMAMMEVTFQCVSLQYSLLKSIHVTTIIPKGKLDDIIRHQFVKQLENLEIDSKPVTPLVDITPLHNTREYTNIVLTNRNTLLGLPSFFQSTYGLYNGGIGTYLYTNADNKPVLAVYPLYNSKHIPTLRKLVVYIPDNDNPSRSINKTSLLDGDELKIIVTTAVKDVGRTDDVSSFDYGSGFATINSNQIMDRVMVKEGDKVSTGTDRFIDSQKEDSSNDIHSIKVMNHTDNLYAVRSNQLFNKSYIKTMQWNFSRPDYLIPGMGVEIIRNYKGEIVKEYGVLMSSHSRYDNKYRNCITRLNVIIN